MNTALVIDSGWYCELAATLAQTFDPVYYWSPWQGDFPYAQDIAPGAGLEGVTRVRDLWDVMDEADVVVFPADGWEDLQLYLRRRGKAVWGSGRGTELEHDRLMFKDYLKVYGLPVVPFEVIIGVNKLYETLRDPEFDGWFVKQSRGFRGDMETWRHRNWEGSRSWFYAVAKQLGPMGDTTVWLVEPPVEGFEGGLDDIAIDGDETSTVIVGYEIKDSCYVATTMAHARLPRVLSDSAEALRGWFRDTGYRNFYSTEVRIDDHGTAYFIDLAARFGWPPTASWLCNCENLGVIIEHGAHGVLVPPEFTKSFMVELNLTSPWLGHEEWLEVEMPASVRPWVKLHGVARMGDTYWVRPQRGQGETGFVGSVVGTADTFDKARKLCIERAKLVEGHKLEYDEGDLAKAEQEIEKGNKAGINFFAH